jgi:hypothetical protein
MSLIMTSGQNKTPFKQITINEKQSIGSYHTNKEVQMDMPISNHHSGKAYHQVRKNSSTERIIPTRRFKLLINI